jgi:hypothetical protein
LVAIAIAVTAKLTEATAIPSVTVDSGYAGLDVIARTTGASGRTDIAVTIAIAAIRTTAAGAPFVTRRGHDAGLDGVIIAATGVRSTFVAITSSIATFGAICGCPLITCTCNGTDISDIAHTFARTRHTGIAVIVVTSVRAVNDLPLAIVAGINTATAAGAVAGFIVVFVSRRA